MKAILQPTQTLHFLDFFGVICRHHGAAGSTESRRRGLRGTTEELLKSEKVRVLVFLEIPRTDPTRFDELKSRVHLAQERVLAALHKSHFVLRRRFQTVPAFAGDITATELERLV